MTEELEPSLPLLGKRRSLDIFVCTIVISLLLHLAASLIFVMPGSLSRNRSDVLFVDLQSIALPGAESRIPETAADKPEEPRLETPVAEPQSMATPETSKLEDAVSGALRRAVQTPEAVHENSIGLGMISGHFASFAQGESLKDDIRVYYFSLMRRVNEVWWTTGATKGSFINSASVNLTISREGKLLNCELLESSGSREQDKMLMEAIKLSQPLPPLPASYRNQVFNAPIRFVPPLRLMLPGLGNRKAPVSGHGE
jgi:TonB family protein